MVGSGRECKIPFAVQPWFLMLSVLYACVGCDVVCRGAAEFLSRANVWRHGPDQLQGVLPARLWAAHGPDLRHLLPLLPPLQSKAGGPGRSLLVQGAAHRQSFLFVSPFNPYIPRLRGRLVFSIFVGGSGTGGDFLVVNSVKPPTAPASIAKNGRQPETGPPGMR